MIEVGKEQEKQRVLLLIKLSGFCSDGRGREPGYGIPSLSVARPTPSDGCLRKIPMTCQLGDCARAWQDGCRSQESCTVRRFLAACLQTSEAWTFTTRTPKKRDERCGRRAG